MKEVSLGNHEAVAELYNDYIDKVYSIVFNQVDRDHDATQEIVQDIFMAAVKSAKKFKGRSKVYTWLYSIAHKKIADYYRRKKRKDKLQISSDIDIESTKDDAVLSNEPVESIENQEVIKQAMDSLPVHYKQVLILKYIEDMQVDEIGEALHRTPKSVEGILSRARKELKIAILKKGVRDNRDLKRLLI
jgi:RNA polymerase sigma-70 factor (ECF subfamily)